MWGPPSGLGRDPLANHPVDLDEALVLTRWDPDRGTEAMPRFPEHPERRGQLVDPEDPQPDALLGGRGCERPQWDRIVGERVADQRAQFGTRSDPARAISTVTDSDGTPRINV